MAPVGRTPPTSDTLDCVCNELARLLRTSAGSARGRAFIEALVDTHGLGILTRPHGEHSVFHDLAASARDRLAQTTYLVHLGVDINAFPDPRTPPKPRYTLLHLAVARHGTEQMRALIALGADINVQPPEGGCTPLHRAVDWRRLEAVELLIERGADPTRTNALGNRPIDTLMRPYRPQSTSGPSVPAEVRRMQVLLEVAERHYRLAPKAPAAPAESHESGPAL